jgi:hypothetical protein
MSDEVSREDIARLEAHIEELAEGIERCRKFSLAAKLLIGAGAAWIALSMLGSVFYTPETTITALAAMILGAVLLGSNSTTWTQTVIAMHKSEALRADMIGRLELRVVDEGVKRVH